MCFSHIGRYLLLSADTWNSDTLYYLEELSFSCKCVISRILSSVFLYYYRNTVEA